MNEQNLAKAASLAGAANANLGERGGGEGFAPYLGFGTPRSAARGMNPWDGQPPQDQAPTERWRHILLARPPTIS